MYCPTLSYLCPPSLSYPRDLQIHHGACMPQTILELDRLLRPGGYAILTGDGLALEVSNEDLAPLGWEMAGEGKADLPGGKKQVEFRVMKKRGGTF